MQGIEVGVGGIIFLFFSFFFFFFSVLGMEPRVSHLLDKPSATRPHPQPFSDRASCVCPGWSWTVILLPLPLQ
jgi:hypothetical protein